jgi:hypothetical protein
VLSVLALFACWATVPVQAGWVDAATGQPVHTIPLTSDPSNLTGNDPDKTGDRNHANVGGKNLFWQPCPPPATATARHLPHVTIDMGTSDGSHMRSGTGLSFGFGMGTDGSDGGSDRPSGLMLGN